MHLMGLNGISLHDVSSLNTPFNYKIINHGLSDATKNVVFGPIFRPRPNGEFLNTFLHDCSDAVDLDPFYSKAYMRRSAAYEMLEELDSALADARKVSAICVPCMMVNRIGAHAG